MSQIAACPGFQVHLAEHLLASVDRCRKPAQRSCVSVSPALHVGRMDKLLTLEGAIGCRQSTWADSDINRAVPFYNRLDDLHANARELPRRADWPEIATIVDELVLRAIQTEKPVNELLRSAAKMAQGLRLKQIARH